MGRQDLVDRETKKRSFKNTYQTDDEEEIKKVVKAKIQNLKLRV